VLLVDPAQVGNKYSNERNSLEKAECIIEHNKGHLACQRIIAFDVVISVHVNNVPVCCTTHHQLMISNAEKYMHNFEKYNSHDHDPHTHTHIYIYERDGEHIIKSSWVRNCTFNVCIYTILHNACMYATHNQQTLEGKDIKSIWNC
jgi:F0F1-type ATP synthase gamma subunit